MIELSHLQYFKEVARTENISKAAKSLYITQPALSQIIRKMEGELGYRLFERTGNRIRLTEAGKCFLSYVNSVFSLLDEGIVKSRKVAQQEEEVFRVVSGLGIVGDLTKKYLEMHPDFKVDVRIAQNEDIIQRLAGGNAAIGFTLGPVSDSRLEQRVIMRGRYYVAVNADDPLACHGEKYISMSDLEGRLLFCSNVANTHEIVSGIMEKAGITCNLLTLDAKEVLFTAAEKGLGGVFCLPMKAMDVAENARSRLIWLPVADCKDIGTVVMLYSGSTYHTEEQERYIRHLEREFSHNEEMLRDELRLLRIPAAEDLE